MVFCAPLDVILTEVDVVEPDVVYVTSEQVARLVRRGVEEPPTLVIEVLSPSTSKRDRTAKRMLYWRQGVPHYWLADPLAETLEICEQRGGRYRGVATLARDAELRPRLFPGLVIPLAEVWPPDELRGR